MAVGSSFRDRSGIAFDPETGVIVPNFRVVKADAVVMGYDPMNVLANMLTVYLQSSARRERFVTLDMPGTDPTDLITMFREFSGGWLSQVAITEATLGSPAATPIATFAASASLELTAASGRLMPDAARKLLLTLRSCLLHPRRRRMTRSQFIEYISPTGFSSDLARGVFMTQPVNIIRSDYHISDTIAATSTRYELPLTNDWCTASGLPDPEWLARWSTLLFILDLAGQGNKWLNIKDGDPELEGLSMRTSWGMGLYDAALTNRSVYMLARYARQGWRFWIEYFAPWIELALASEEASFDPNRYRPLSLLRDQVQSEPLHPISAALLRPIIGARCDTPEMPKRCLLLPSSLAARARILADAASTRRATAHAPYERGVYAHELAPWISHFVSHTAVHGLGAVSSDHPSSPGSAVSASVASRLSSLMHELRDWRDDLAAAKVMTSLVDADAKPWARVVPSVPHLTIPGSGAPLFHWTDGQGASGSILDVVFGTHYLLPTSLVQHRTLETEIRLMSQQSWSIAVATIDVDPLDQRPYMDRFMAQWSLLGELTQPVAASTIISELSLTYAMSPEEVQRLLLQRLTPPSVIGYSFPDRAGPQLWLTRSLHESPITEVVDNGHTTFAGGEYGSYLILGDPVASPPVSRLTAFPRANPAAESASQTPIHWGEITLRQLPDRTDFAHRFALILMATMDYRHRWQQGGAIVIRNNEVVGRGLELHARKVVGPWNPVMTHDADFHGLFDVLVAQHDAE